MGRRIVTTDPVNKEISEKIRRLRILRGLSRQEFANKLKLTHQQVSKYELGTNRVCFSRLIEIAKVLNVDVVSFMPDANIPEDDEVSRLTMEVSKSFSKIKDYNTRYLLSNLIRKLAQ